MDLFDFNLISKQLNKNCILCNGSVFIGKTYKNDCCYVSANCLKCPLKIYFNDFYLDVSNDILFLYTEIEFDRIEIVSNKMDDFTGHPIFYMKITFEQWIESFEKFDLETSIKVLDRFSKNYMFM